ncbi:hypothetical protein KBY96_02190 [Cyanobium sp. ATX 6A2]|uniref:hypothetical protein n=1 Tax=Cyanobium sp. ATX 6A2 TaxID=2823700 RepID=UPI0020CDC3F9|nr:hypothetical protein [Cyanobium sp. ATX 6A2]MCP9886748.1 hypothetical protein [Cyanobium sp. ATX 6A2]
MKQMLQRNRLLSTLIGVALGYAIVQRLPLVPATLVSALVLAAGAGFCNQLRHPGSWWGVIGLACGALVGTGTVLADKLKTADPADHASERGLVVLALVVAGAIVGQLFGNAANLNPNQQPRDLIRSASALTTGVFAAIVTLTYVHSGLDVARTFSSRLSTALTILVVSLAAPAWASHLVRLDRRRNQDQQDG